MGYTGLAWWAAGLVCLLGALECMWLKDVDEKVDDSNMFDEEEVEAELFINPLAIDAAIVAAGGSGETLADEFRISSQTPPTVDRGEAAH